MRKIIGIGETVLDIIFRNDQPIQALPGGSTFNAIISLSRSGVNTSFISETGNDRVGRMIIQFLKDNGCEADSVSVYPDSKSPLSLAFLNDQNDAEYIFYKDHPHDRLDFTLPEINEDDIVLFGSYYAVNPVIRPQVKAFLDYAHERGAILYYDVNFRASHQYEVMKLTPTCWRISSWQTSCAVRQKISRCSSRRTMLSRCTVRRLCSTRRNSSIPMRQHLSNCLPTTD